MMELYHGSTRIIDIPIIVEPSRTLDFGKGFYTTSSKMQAVKWAKNKAKLEDAEPYVTIFELSEDLADICSLNVKIFEKADEEWLDFVLNNRKVIDYKSEFDIIYGPVANDRVYTSINAYENGFMDKKTLLSELKTWLFIDQIVFKNDKSLKQITFKEGMIV